MKAAAKSAPAKKAAPSRRVVKKEAAEEAAAAARAEHARRSCGSGSRRARPPLRQADELQAEAELLASEREQGDTQFDEESGEGDTVSVERERDLALSATARQTVEDIERALDRMPTGTYGLCVTCGDRIPVARLEVLPWAVQCVKCKARGERRR